MTGLAFREGGGHARRRAEGAGRCGLAVDADANDPQAG
jgi:hypothetical protein